jgi:thiol-disulfide isomerase/thioredoxin
MLGSKMMRPTRHKFTYLLLGVAALLSRSTSAEAQTLSAKLTQDPQGAEKARVGYFPMRVALSLEKPKEIKKEPTYRTAPKYATIQVGNGPKSTFVIALDEPKEADWKIYIDLNRNGDLTDEGDGAWAKKNTNEKTGRVMYGVSNYLFRASYGDAKREKSSADYGISFYRFADLDFLLMYRTAARTGTLEALGKNYKVTLMENDADGLYDKPIDDDGKPLRGKQETRPVWLILEEDTAPQQGQPARRPRLLNASAPFAWEGKVYEAQIAPDGSTLKLVPTKRAAYAPKAPERPPLLAKGVTAPDFTADKWGGGTLKLSDYRGKVVILDFWATWCGPCMKSMPHLEKVYKGLSGQEVVVLALCVSDTRSAYEKWVPDNKEKYTFQFAFDPAERDPKKSISSNLFKVSGIPTTYIIDKEGKVVEAVVGYDENDRRIEAVLKTMGIEVKE